MFIFKIMKKEDAEKLMKWKIHTTNMLAEFIQHAKLEAGASGLKILYGILQQVARRCSEVDDPQLNALMCRLTMYTISDPTHKDYDEKKLEEILIKGARDE